MSIKRMKELVILLNNASEAYYNGKTELMSDKDFDRKMEELDQLEKMTGVVMIDSPLHKVGFQILNELEEVKHTHPMLSQEKIHSAEEIISFAKGRDIYMSLKLDGLSLSLGYDKNGCLIRSDTRGDGYKGNNCTHHVKQFMNTPLKISKENYEIDGEAIIKIDDFNNYNNPLIEKAEKEGKLKGLCDDKLEKYIKENSFANPRNLASGTLNSLNNKLTKERKLRFIAWNVISGDDSDSYAERMQHARDLGFEIAPFTLLKYPFNKEELEKKLEWFKKAAIEQDLPYDGVVISYNSISHVKSLGNREKTPRGSVAYKYEDDTYPTKLKKVEFTLGKSGVLTPNAEFSPVIIDGTTVTNASLYNISCMKELGITNGCTCHVKKCNLIIPAVESCDNDGNGEIEIPKTCPVCGGKTEIVSTGNADVLMCTNQNCSGKILKKMSAFVGKDAINIDGLSEATLNLLLTRGFINTYKDLYHLYDFKAELSTLPKMGSRSVKKLLDSIEKSRNTTLERFITSLSIPGIGKSIAKDISNYCNGDIGTFIFIMENTSYEFTNIDGFGITVAVNLDEWWNNNKEMLYDLKEEFTFEKKEEKSIVSKVNLAGKTFVVTGSVTHYKNRSELQKEIESLGGKVSGSVSAKTFALINNDTESTSSKNVKAKQNGIPIWSEEQFLEYIKGE